MKVTVIAIIVLCVGLGYSAWRYEKDIKAAKTFAAEKQTQIDALTSQMQVREKAFQSEKATLVKERDDIKTQKQAVKTITKYLPGIAGNIVEVKPEDLPEKIKAALPDSPGYTCMTEQAAVNLGKAVVDLQTCNLTTGKLTLDKADLTSQLKLTTEQRDNWQVTAQGGSKWQKTKTAGKWVLVGGVVGYAVSHVR